MGAYKLYLWQAVGMLNGFAMSISLYFVITLGRWGESSALCPSPLCQELVYIPILPVGILAGTGTIALSGAFLLRLIRWLQDEGRLSDEFADAEETFDAATEAHLLGFMTGIVSMVLLWASFIALVATIRFYFNV